MRKHSFKKYMKSLTNPNCILKSINPLQSVTHIPEFLLEDDVMGLITTRKQHWDVCKISTFIAKVYILSTSRSRETSFGVEFGVEFQAKMEINSNQRHQLSSFHSNGAFIQLFAIHLEPSRTSHPPCKERTSCVPSKPVTLLIMWLYHITALPLAGRTTTLAS